MERIKKLIHKPIKKEGRRIDHEFQALGLEIEDFFKISKPFEEEDLEKARKRQKNALWASFWRIPAHYHRDALTVCQKRGISDIRYFWGVIKKLKI